MKTDPADVELVHLLTKFEDNLTYLKGMPDLSEEAAHHAREVEALKSLVVVEGDRENEYDYYPRAFLEAIGLEVNTRTSHQSIAEQIKKNDPEAKDFFGPQALSYSKLWEWRAANGVTSEVWTTSLDYLATGEGRSLRLLAYSAYGYADALVTAWKALGWYFLIGARVQQGVPAKDEDTAVDFLLSATGRKFLLSEASAPADRRGHIDVDLKFHFNYS